MAGSFSRRLHAFCAKQGIPIIEAGSGQRKHELAEPCVPKDPTLTGSKSIGTGARNRTGNGARPQPVRASLFLVITGNAPAPIWEVKRNAVGHITEIRHRKNWPFVKHYYFHIIDREWGT